MTAPKVGCPTNQAGRTQRSAGDHRGAKARFDLDCPAMGRVDDVLAVIEQCGFELLGHFTLPDEVWWMECCGNLDEVCAWLARNRLMRCVSIAACDTRRQAVFEVTAKRMLSRDATDGVCCATNQFRHPELAGDDKCLRYSRLEESRKMAHLGVMEVASLMKATHQGKMTIHTMVFEPASLRIRLALGPGPATSRVG